MIKKDKVFTNDKKKDKKKIKCSQMIKKDKVFTNDKKRIKCSQMIKKG